MEIEEGGQGGGRSGVMLVGPGHFSSRPFKGSQRPVLKAIISLSLLEVNKRILSWCGDGQRFHRTQKALNSQGKNKLDYIKV